MNKGTLANQIHKDTKKIIHYDQLSITLEIWKLSFD